MDNHHNNKRIAKNAFFLYVRMFLVMLVTLYTSRVVLELLGVIDYGIYNVVGGIVVFLGFFTSSLSNVTQRYLSLGLGRKDIKLTNNYFNQILLIYLVFSLVVLLLGETIGTWFVDTQLDIPAERKYAAFWAYQFSLFTTIIAINQVAFTGVIIAREKMSIYAYVGIIEVILRLLCVYVLLYWKHYENLILYAVLVCVSYMVVFIIYLIYTIRKFPECHIRFYWSPGLVKEMLSFVKYNIFGCFAVAAGSQGNNILLNMFFGPTVNAARAISVQINAAVSSFSQNITTAIKPQMIKSYASEDHEYMHILIRKSSLYVFLLVSIIDCVLFFNMDYILSIWLKNVPLYCSIFSRLVLIESLIGTLVTPLWDAANATGYIKRSQIFGRSFILSSLPVSYLLLKLFHNPIIPFILLIMAQIGYWLYSLYDIHRQINFSIYKYAKEVVYPILFVLFFNVTICCIECWIMENGVLRIFLMGGSIVISSLACCYFFIFGHYEKHMILNILKTLGYRRND